MRVRLVYTLSFWLLGAVLVSVLAMGGVMAWSLRAGFGAYLQARDVERLELFVQIAEQKLATDDGIAALRERRDIMPELLREVARGDGLKPPPAPPQSAAQRAASPPTAFGEPPSRRPLRDKQDFGARLSLLAPDYTVLYGPPAGAPGASTIDRPIIVAGQTLAVARLRVLARSPDRDQTRFLRSQYYSIGAVSSALVLLALLCAWWLARQWGQPLAAVQDATARIARGELGVRIADPRSKDRGDEFGDLVRNVNLMADSLQRIEGARRRWIADMSHELRTPLAVLRGEIEALVDGIRPLTTIAVVSLHEEALRLGALVDDLHLLAMADLQALPCRYAAADAVELLQRAQRRFAARAAQAGLVLDVAATPSATIDVLWDAARIEQLLDNLLQNSLRYTDAPGRIVMSMRLEDDVVVIEFNDSAPGVANSDLDRLFEPLYRADAARSRHSGGSGLGLAICRAIVTAHGGQISAGPSQLGGLQLQISIPRRAPAAAQQEANHAPVA